MYNLHYYCIHNLDEKRKRNMNDLFERFKFDLNKITWINKPNKQDIPNQLFERLIIQDVSLTNGIQTYPNQLRWEKGKAVCTYKHYLALIDMIHNGYDYAVIMEDNIYMSGPVPEYVEKCIQQLNEKYPDWDICFDNKNIPYIEQSTTDDCYVYPKSNEITQQCHGGTRCACFYIVNKKAALNLTEHWIPFNNSPDWWMNDLFRKINIKSFWIHPCYIFQPPHECTAN